MSVFQMPSLGADMEEGRLVEWLVGPGDRVARGDVIAVVETQKGAIEIEIFESGEVTELLAQPGATLPVGAPLARIGTRGGEGDVDRGAVAPAAESEPTRPRTDGAPEPEPTAETSPKTGAVADAWSRPARTAEPARPQGGLVASPAARTRAAEAGIELADVAGSGPGGAVLLADVERHLEAGPRRAIASQPKETPRGVSGIDMAEMRRAISAAMSRAKREIPHYYLSHEIDLQAAHDWLSAENAARSPENRLLMGALLIRASVRALARTPELNGRFEDDPFTPSTPVHCGLAVAMRGGGLIAPAILDAADKNVDATMAAMRDIVARTRTGRLRMSEITQGTITVSSLGENGVDALYGVIYPPQVALVGFGAPRIRSMVRDGDLAPRLAVTASLAADHRISDGRRGALYLAEIDRLLQEPETL